MPIGTPASAGSTSPAAAFASISRARVSAPSRSSDRKAWIVASSSSMRLKHSRAASTAVVVPFAMPFTSSSMEGSFTSEIFVVMK